MIQAQQLLICGTCRHWRKSAPNPMNLGAVQQGECREGPPLAMPGMTPTGKQTIISFYQLLPSEFPACDRHSPADAK